MEKTIDELLKFGIKITKKAGKIIMKRYGQVHKIEFKKANDLVTEADKKAEVFLIKKIRSHYPHHEILAEESGINPVKELDGEKIRWIIDPIDGTTNFAHGFPFFAISIGIEKNGEMIGGIVYAPYMNELFHAGKYMGAYLNGKKIDVSDTEELEYSLLATGFPPENRDMNLPYLVRYLDVVQALRRSGSAAMDLCYVACGRLDGFWEFGLKQWDVAAGSLIVEEAGGRVTNFDGTPFNINARNILATNSLIHEEMMGEGKI
jgi:myo-inositol-1(or 4)-monophosphatase